ncbi:MAG: T6SS immunity protein Tdi1 domain-containing protein [Saprospiraceae bacterium]
MNSNNHLFLSKSKYNPTDLLIPFEWLLNNQFELLEVSLLGDAFLQNEKEEIYWLATDSGELQKIANSKQEFYYSLEKSEQQEEWLMISFIQELKQAKIQRAANEVYSYKVPPVLGGEYDITNIQVTNVDVHFYLLGQIFEQIRHLPDGHSVKITIKK